MHGLAPRQNGQDGEEDCNVSVVQMALNDEFCIFAQA